MDDLDKLIAKFDTEKQQAIAARVEELLASHKGFSKDLIVSMAQARDQALGHEVPGTKVSRVETAKRDTR